MGFASRTCAYPRASRIHPAVAEIRGDQTLEQAQTPKGGARRRTIAGCQGEPGRFDLHIRRIARPLAQRGELGAGFAESTGRAQAAHELQ